MVSTTIVTPSLIMTIQALFIHPMTFGMSMRIQTAMAIQVLVLKPAFNLLDLWRTILTVTM